MAHGLQVVGERDRGGLRQHGHTVLAALTVPHEQLPGSEVDVLDPKRERLQQAEARSVEQERDEPRLPLEPAQHRPHLGPGEHDREANRPFGPNDLPDGIHRCAEHLPVEEDERRARLALRGGAHLPAHCQVGQEGLNLAGAELPRVAQTVEADEPRHPAYVDRLGAPTVVPQANGLAHRREQLRRTDIRRQSGPGSGSQSGYCRGAGARTDVTGRPGHMQSLFRGT